MVILTLGADTDDFESYFGWYYFLSANSILIIQKKGRSFDKEKYFS